MLRGKDFIIFSDDWGRHPFSCQHIMEHFLPHNRLLWVQTIGLRTPRLTLYDMRRSLEKIGSWVAPKDKAGQAPLPKNLHVLSPVMVPFNTFPMVRSFNRRSVVKAIRRAMRALGMRDPILLTTLPNACDYVGFCGESLVVYYCVDDFTLWPGMNQPELVRSMEKKLLSQADFVAATSQSLCATRLCRNGPTYYLPHGVDMPHFSTAAHAAEQPESLRALPRPVIGFYGLLDERLDEALLVSLLDARPEWTLLCIGPRRAALKELSGRANFHWVPQVPYSVLPQYAACFDVAIIPYLVSDLTRSINPLKIREYIATGKPVVSTPLPEAAALLPALRIADGARNFITAIEDALADITPAQERLKFLQGEGWADRAHTLAGWMRTALHSPASAPTGLP